MAATDAADAIGDDKTRSFAMEKNTTNKFGAVGSLTSSQVREAATLVKSGRVYSLAVETSA